MLFISWLGLFWASFGITIASTTSEPSSPWVDYIVEPFDDASLASSSLSSQVLTLEEMFITEGGIPAISQEQNTVSIRCNPTGTTATTVNDEVLSLLSIRLVTPDRHNVIGATHVSFEYQYAPEGATNPSFSLRPRLNLWDSEIICDEDAVTSSTSSSSSSSPCREGTRELWSTTDNNTTTTTTTVARAVVVRPNEWNKFVIPLNQLVLVVGDDRTTGRSNGKLDLDRIVDWQLQFDYLVKDDPPCQGSILVRQLCFHGGGDLVAAALHSRSWKEGNDHQGGLARLIHLSPLSENKTYQSLNEKGDFNFHYVAEQREVWGGFIQYRHMAPGRSYYNLSRAEVIRLDYTILEPAHPQGRAHFRLMLLDGNGCRDECGANDNVLKTEVYYSFHYILEDPSHQQRSIAIELQGDQSSNSSFWRTGWIGVEDNNVLDKGYIKGFAFEVSLNSQGSIGSTVTGAVVVTNLTVSPHYQRTVSIQEGIVYEPLLRFANLPLSEFERLEFVNLEKCERECLARSSTSCNMAMSTDYGKDCYIGTSVVPQNVALSNTTYAQESAIAFWIDTISSRGQACQVCRCSPMTGLIDCTGLDLVFPPKALTNWTWTPRKLDLRNNPRMTIIGDGCLRGYDTIEHIYFPANMSYLAPSNMDYLPALINLEYEATNTNMVTNVVTRNDELFADKCCSKVQRGNFTSMHFCDLKVDVPGDDSSFEPFIQLLPLEQLDMIEQSASFLSEAAESAQKCASICAIRADCYYFSFDGRIGASSKICYHIKTIVSRYKNCCNPGDYQDENQTIPGWISGRVPRTRCIEDNAKVLVTTASKLELTASNRYRVNYTVRLGANPLRGAVWIKPTVLLTSDLDIAFDPSEVALYDMEPTTISVYLSKSPQAGTRDQSILIDNKVESCDAAFATTSSCASEDELHVFVEFISEKASQRATLAISFAVVSAMILVGLAGTLWYANRKVQQANALWKICSSQVVYTEPPVCIGRGKFGHVVKASFCGTPVAIKRVLPTEQNRNDDMVLYGFPSGNREESVPTSHVNVDVESSLQLCDARKEYWLNALKPATTDRKALRSNFLVDIQRLSQGAIDSFDPLLVIEYMEHGSLRDVLSNETFAFDGEMLLPILQDITQGLRFLHSISPQIVHGDFKAANCLVDKRFHAKLSDFGLGLTRNIGARGSPFWMAPELLRGETTNTPESDVFALGIVLYESKLSLHCHKWANTVHFELVVYSRQEPYEGEDIFFVCEQVSDPIVKMRPSYDQICPSEICKLIEDCLQHDPQSRPTVRAIDEQVQTWEIEDIEPKTNTFSVQPSRRHSSENVLYDIFPRHVADALKEGRQVETEDHELVTIFFSDIVNYTTYSQSLEPRKVANLLDRLYKAFDDLSDVHSVRKVETIGDSWMGVTNLSGSQPDDHAARVARFSFAALQVAGNTLIDLDHPEMGCVVIRVGFHSGPVVADVVGARNPRYCLFGDTVNTASRMESHSKPGLVHCSEVSAHLVQEQDPSIDIISRGSIDIKGKGPMVTYFVRPKTSDVKLGTPSTGSRVETTVQSELLVSL